MTDKSTNEKIKNIDNLIGILRRCKLEAERKGVDDKIEAVIWILEKPETRIASVSAAISLLCAMNDEFLETLEVTVATSRLYMLIYGFTDDSK